MEKHDCQYKEKLKAVLEGLECQRIDFIIEEADIETSRKIGQTIASLLKSLAPPSVQNHEPAPILQFPSRNKS